MSIRTSRRDFVRNTTAGLAVLSYAGVTSAQTPGPVVVHQTAGTKRFAEEPAIQWRAVSNPAEAITIDPTRTYQDIVGFGGALTEASAYMINQLDPDARERFLHELFHPSELGISATRICVGASDYATRMYSYDEGAPDPELERFSIDYDRPYVIPELVAARRNNPVCSSWRRRGVPRVG